MTWLTNKLQPTRTHGADVDPLTSAHAFKLSSSDEVRTLPALNVRLHIDDYYDTLGREQVALYEAQSEEQCREVTATAAGVLAQATTDAGLVATLTTRVEEDEAQLQHTHRVLDPLRTRRPGDIKRYKVTQVGLLLGDITGITGAAILFGELVALAFVQAIAVGVAMITIGMVASEVKHTRLRRQRAGAVLPADGDRFAHLLASDEAGEHIVRWVLITATVALGLVGVGIFALRAAIEGTTAGLVFGSLAMVTMLGSAANSYVFADDIDDVVQIMEARQRDNIKTLQALSRSTALALIGKAENVATGIRAENERRGEAASLHCQAAATAVKIHNPAIAGHGNEIHDDDESIASLLHLLDSSDPEDAA